MNDPNTGKLEEYFVEYNIASVLDGTVAEGLRKRILCIDTGTQRNWTNLETNTLLAISDISKRSEKSSWLANSAESF